LQELIELKNAICDVQAIVNDLENATEEQIIGAITALEVFASANDDSSEQV